MGLLVLIVCVITAWVMSNGVSEITHLGGLLVPPRWVLMGTVLILATVLMRD